MRRFARSCMTQTGRLTLKPANEPTLREFYGVEFGIMARLFLSQRFCNDMPAPARCRS